MRRMLVILGIMLISAVLVRAESIRPLLTKENRFPELHQFEAGAVVEYDDISQDRMIRDGRQYGDRTEWWTTPYVRFGALDNLAVYAKTPVGSVDVKNGDNEAGFGDISAGFELLAFEDTLGYPWIIPHAEIYAGTGDGEKWLGYGETRVKGGVSVGTTVEDVWHFVLDGSYEFISNQDNVACGAVSVMWELSEEFSLLAETSVTNEKEDGFRGWKNPVRAQGGLLYAATEALQINVYGGGVWDSETDSDALAAIKVSYSF